MPKIVVEIVNNPSVMVSVHFSLKAKNGAFIDVDEAELTELMFKSCPVPTVKPNPYVANAYGSLLNALDGVYVYSNQELEESCHLEDYLFEDLLTREVRDKLETDPDFVFTEDNDDFIMTLQFVPVTETTI